MKIIDKPEHSTVKRFLTDLIDFEGGDTVVSDDRAVIVRAGDIYKCLFDCESTLDELTGELDAAAMLCVFGLPKDFAVRHGIDAVPCHSFAYLKPLPPPLDPAVDIKRLAPTLSGVIASSYRIRDDKGITEAEAETLLREKGMFGAFTNSSLSGFIGRHDDGTMGLLHVFEKYRRRGLGTALLRFMINYVMTFGRTPLCDVFCDNAASVAMQRDCGMTEAEGYTFWYKNN